MISITVIIPTFNRGSVLRRALDTVVDQDFSCANYEILVVDNASTDDTPAISEEAIQRAAEHSIRYIYEPVPGLLAARHRGAAEAQGSILVFIDDDIEADHGWLTAIHDAFQDPQVHMVGGKCLPLYEGTPSPEWIRQISGPLPSYATFFCGALSLIDCGDQRREIDASHIWGLNYSIRRETLYRLGGFHPDTVPPRYQRYQGDGETGLSIKLKEHGLKAIYEPRALVHHRVPAERLTDLYMEKRKYFQGICDSYTSVRKTGKLGYMSFFTTFPASEQETLNYRMQTAFVCGYNWHQNEVRKDPKLLEWILKENYFNYDYPA